MNNTNLLFIILFLFSSLRAFSQDNWKLVYENDAEGNAIQGELNDLMDAIQRGQEIRIYFIMGDNESYVEHMTDAKFVAIMNSGDGPFVTAQIDPIIGQTPNFKEQQVTLKENLEWSLIASTTGKNDTMFRNVITGEVVDHQIRKWGTKWFVKE